MTAIRRRLVHPIARAMLSEAGPPNAWQGASLVIAAIVGSMVASLPGVVLVVPAVLALVIVAIPAIADGDGWRTRLGMAWLSAEQRRRGLTGIPRTPAGADRWLAEHADAHPRLRASVLMTAGRAAEARPVLESMSTETPEDRAVVARMLAAIDGIERGSVDPRRATEAIEALPPDQRAYHGLSLAWSIAWVEKANGRPWRRGFATASRGIDAREIPTHWLIGLSAQQLLLPLCVAVVFAIWTLIILSQ